MTNNNGGVINNGTFNGTVTNNSSGVINNGTFGSTVTNTGTIDSGTFNGAVTNDSGGTINGGTFSSAVTSGGSIIGGTFSSTVTNDGTINDGTFKAAVTNNSGGKIKGGTFKAAVTNNSGGAIESGAFNGAVSNSGTIDSGTFNSTVGSSGIIDGGTFNSTVGSSGIIDGGTFSSAVISSGIIDGGTFSNAVSNVNGFIYDGTFSSTVTNDSGGTIIYGTFNGTVTNNSGGTIDDGAFNGAVTNERGSNITDGTFCGAVTNNGTINGGSFYGLVPTGGTIDTDKIKTYCVSGIPSALDLGSALSKTVTVSNDGNQSVKISAALSGGAGFSVSPAEITLGASGTSTATGTFTVSLSQDALGDYADTLTLSSYDGSTAIPAISGGKSSSTVALSGTVAVTVIPELSVAASGSNWSYDGTTLTLSKGFFDVGSFGGAITNNGTITAGTPGGEVDNNGTISGGTFSNMAINYGTISNGTFNGSLYVEFGGSVNGGTFSRSTFNNGTISNGTFSGTVDNYSTINGGEFNASVTNESGSNINGGTFKGAVTNSGDISGGSFYGNIVHLGNFGGTAKKYYLGADKSSVTSTAAAGSAVGTVTLTNAGTGDIKVLLPQFGGSSTFTAAVNTGEFTGGKHELSAGESVSFSVMTKAGTTRGTYTDTLEIAAEDVNVKKLSVAVTCTVAAKPETPTGLTTKVGPTKDSLILEWVAPADGGQPITKYKLSVFTGSDTDITPADIMSSGLPADSTAYTMNGLMEHESYRFELQAVNVIGESEKATKSVDDFKYGYRLNLEAAQLGGAAEIEIDGVSYAITNNSVILPDDTAKVAAIITEENGGSADPHTRYPKSMKVFYCDMTTAPEHTRRSISSPLMTCCNMWAAPFALPAISAYALLPASTAP